MKISREEYIQFLKKYTETYQVTFVPETDPINYSKGIIGYLNGFPIILDQTEENS